MTLSQCQCALVHVDWHQMITCASVLKSHHLCGRCLRHSLDMITCAQTDMCPVTSVCSKSCSSMLKRSKPTDPSLLCSQIWQPSAVIQQQGEGYVWRACNHASHKKQCNSHICILASIFSPFPDPQHWQDLCMLHMQATTRACMCRRDLKASYNIIASQVMPLCTCCEMICCKALYRCCSPIKL